MRRATVTIPDELEDQLDRYLGSQDPAPSLTAVLQTALRRFLSEQKLEARGYEPARGPLRITPAPLDDGPTDVSVEHDRYLYETEPVPGS